MYNYVSRRTITRLLGALGLMAGVALLGLASPPTVLAQSAPADVGRPGEKADTTLKRLFGDRPVTAADGEVKFDAPLIAEDDSRVPVTVEADLPMTPASYVRNIYIIVDENRHPLAAKFSLTPDAGQAFIGTNVRVGKTTEVRAVVEMNDGTLYVARRKVKVTVGGCGG